MTFSLIECVVLEKNNNSKISYFTKYHAKMSNIQKTHIDCSNFNAIKIVYIFLGKI